MNTFFYIYIFKKIMYHKLIMLLIEWKLIKMLIEMVDQAD